MKTTVPQITMSDGFVPQMAKVNPEPIGGDRWFNYRSMTTLWVEMVDAEKAYVINEANGKKGKIRLSDFKVTKFLRHMMADAPRPEWPNGERPISKIVGGGGIASGIREMNAKLSQIDTKLWRLIELWESKPKT